MFLSRLTALAVTACLSLAGIAHAKDTLYFSAIPDDDETRLAERFGAAPDASGGERPRPTRGAHGRHRNKRRQ